MYAMRAFVCVGLLSYGSAVCAQVQMSHGDDLAGLLGAKVYSTWGCPGGGTHGELDCHVTSSAEAWPWPIPPPPYTVLATLELPAGNYLLFGKFSSYPEAPSTYPAVYWGGLECLVGLPDLSQGDWTTTGFSEDQNVVINMVPIRLTARSTKVMLGCRLNGMWYWEADGYDSRQPVQVGIWGAKLIAVRVGVVVEQPCHTVCK